MAWQMAIPFALAGLQLFSGNRQIRQAQRMERDNLRNLVKRNEQIFQRQEFADRQEEIDTAFGEAMEQRLLESLDLDIKTRLERSERTEKNAQLHFAGSGVSAFTGTAAEVGEEIDRFAAQDIRRLEKHRGRGLRQQGLQARQRKISSALNALGGYYAIQSGSVPKGDYTGMMLNNVLNAVGTYRSAGGSLPSLGGGGSSTPKEWSGFGPEDFAW